MLTFADATQAEQYQLGAELDYNGERALVVRIVDHCALFEIPLKRYAVDELYVELMTAKGETVFVSLRRQVHDLIRPPDCSIRGPEPLMKMTEDNV